MTEDMQALRDDIAYLKALADSGQDGSHKGGWILVASGGLYGLASLAQWAVLEHLAPQMLSNLAWTLALVLFIAALVVTSLRQRSEGVKRKPIGVAWSGVGFALFALFAAISLATWRTQSDILIRFSPAIVLALYGAAWWVAAAIAGKLWLRLTALASFGGALVSGYLVADNAQWLFYAAALFFLAFVPGVVFLAAGRNRGA